MSSRRRRRPSRRGSPRLAIPNPLTHSLQVLLRLLAAKGVATAPFEGLADFTPYAVELRYEGVGADAEPIDRKATLARLVISLDGVRRQVDHANPG